MDFMSVLSDQASDDDEDAEIIRSSPSRSSITDPTGYRRRSSRGLTTALRRVDAATRKRLASRLMAQSQATKSPEKLSRHVNI